MQNWKYGFWIVSILFVFHLISSSYYKRELKSRIVDLGRVVESTTEKWDSCEKERSPSGGELLIAENNQLRDLNEHYYSIIKKEILPALQIDLKLDDESIEGYELSDQEVTLAPQGTVVYKARIKVREKSFVDEANFLDCYPDTTEILDNLE